MKAELLRLWEFHSAAIIELVKNLVASALIVIIGTALSKGARRLIGKAASGKFPVDETIGSLLRMIVRYGIFIICVIMILNIFGVNTASLIAVLGAAGVAIGLALKDTLGNIAAGIILLFLGSCRKGEYIEFGGYSGTVKEINLFTTVLETPDGIYISAPNSSIWGSPLKNYTRNGKRRMEIAVGISYSDSLEAAFQVMRDIIAAESRFLTEPAPQVILRSIEDSSISIAIRAWALNEVYWDIYWDLMRTVKPKMEEAGLCIPFPQRGIHIVEVSRPGLPRLT
ncbi:MAG: mechanosensitive ion channel [Treponema sp.]|jgi:small conductance mechanosensitive channel|nr:mechanosensitive ion channel [Treponema sp.]